MEKAEKLIDSIAIGVSVISQKMEILWPNKTLKEWFPSVDVGKKPLCYRSFYSPSKKGICDYCPTIKTFEDGEVHSSETGVCADGNFYLVTAAPLKDEKGEVTAVVESVQNITEWKKAEETRAFLANITEHATDAIVGLDLDTNIVSWNRGAEMLFGYSAQERIHEDRGNHEDCKGRRAISSGDDANCTEDEKGEHIGFVSITRDITERKQAEEALEERLKELERMHRAFVDRELKMKELKEEIKKLRERLGER